MRSSKRAAPRSDKSRERTLLDISPIVDKLGKAQTLFLRAADEISSQHWNTKPEAEKWSGAEVVAHLILVERGVNDAAKRVTQKTPKSFKPWQKMHLPLWLVEARIIRRKSPIPLDPTLLGIKEDMLTQLRVDAHEDAGFPARNAEPGPGCVSLEARISGQPDHIRVVRDDRSASDAARKAGAGVGTPASKSGRNFAKTVVFFTPTLSLLTDNL